LSEPVRSARPTAELSHRARLRVCLGWSDEERAQPQAVDLTIRIEFAAPPPACRTDVLADTVSYVDLIERAQAACGARPFRLIEHLAQTLAADLRSLLPAGAALELTVSKPYPPVPWQNEGVHFTLRLQA
jgi:FolB domain-containing protein